MPLKKHIVDYIIIGSGIAGLSAALNISTTKKVLLISKEKIKHNTSSWAQGGIAAAISKNDSIENHIQDTLKAGYNLCNKDRVKAIIQEGPKEIKKLLNWGIAFDQKNKKLALTKEGAHTQKRVLHKKDQTGKEIITKLYKTIQSKPNITCLENTFIYSLLIKNETCLGCLGTQNKENIMCVAENTILATGGYAQIFQHNTNPKTSSGDGLALAYNAGCQIENLEFIQFHPTTTQFKNKTYLISEAVRGEGGILITKNDQKIMKNKHPLEDLAPRDIIAREIENQKKNLHQTVYLKFNNNLDLKKRFPSIYNTCIKHKINIEKDPVPVYPAAHYCMGGIKTDQYGQTNIKNLYAIGETASTGLHGANRLASNSLLEGLVMGSMLGEKFKKNKEKKEKTTPPPSPKNILIKKDKKIYKLKKEIQTIAQTYIGLKRDESNLKIGLKEIKKIKKKIDQSNKWQPNIETYNLALITELTLLFCLNRKESRGAHNRKDFKTTEKNYEKSFMLNKNLNVPVTSI